MGPVGPGDDDGSVAAAGGRLSVAEPAPDAGRFFLSQARDAALCVTNTRALALLA